jgi:hypothetical protein
VTEPAPPAGVPTTVKAYALVVLATYALRATDTAPAFPWAFLVVQLLLVAGVWRGWAVTWALAVLLDLVPVALAVFLTSFTELTLPGVALLVLGVASVVLLLARPTRRHVFGEPPARRAEAP